MKNCINAFWFILIAPFAIAFILVAIVLLSIAQVVCIRYD